MISYLTILFRKLIISPAIKVTLFLMGSRLPTLVLFNLSELGDEENQ